MIKIISMISNKEKKRGFGSILKKKWEIKVLTI